MIRAKIHAHFSMCIRRVLNLRWCLVLTGVAFLVGLLAPAPTWANTSTPQPSTPQDEFARLNRVVEDAVHGAEAGDTPLATTLFERYHEGWEQVEDSVRALSPEAYREIEEAIERVEFALAVQPRDPKRIADALEELERAGEAFVAGRTSAASQPAGEASSLTETLAYLHAAEEGLERNDLSAATVSVQAFRSAWPEIEGEVRSRSQDLYRATEDNMVRASELLTANPPDTDGARELVHTMLADLTPLARRAPQYTALDAAIILLREGLEALLIIAALLAFLSLAGHAQLRGWVWSGGALGVVASILTAVVVQLLFGQVMTGTNRETIEGVTSLVAAVMLFTVSYWLHDKARLAVWQQYIREHTTRALSTGRLASLATLAFLAVYREGAETTLFYIGIAPSISVRDLLLGMGIAVAVLAAVAALVLGIGVRIPTRAFFLISSLLVYYLGFKFVGVGIHALQIANVLPATTANYLPSSDLLGLYPTWQTTLLQAILLLLAAGIIFYRYRIARSMRLNGSR